MHNEEWGCAQSYHNDLPFDNMSYLCNYMEVRTSTPLTLELLDQTSNSPYYQPYNSYNVSSKNLVLNQLIIPKLIFFFILITYLFDIVLIL